MTAALIALAAVILLAGRSPDASVAPSLPKTGANQPAPPPPESPAAGAAGEAPSPPGGLMLGAPSGGSASSVSGANIAAPSDTTLSGGGDGSSFQHDDVPNPTAATNYAPTA